MRAARLVACTAVAAFALAPAASGAARACNLVVDPRGDLSHGAGTRPVDGYYVSTDLDVVGADVASNARYVTAVVRLVTLRESDPDAPTGRWYEVAFRVDGRHYKVWATYGPDGYYAWAHDVDAGMGIGDAGVVLDHAKREVRVTAPASYFGVRKGVVVSGLTVVTGHHAGLNSGRGISVVPGHGLWVGGGGATHHLDEGRSGRTYVAGSPSCVAVGR